MLEFIKTFIKNYLFPIVKQAVAQAVVNQIEDAVYGPRNRPVRRSYGPVNNYYGGPRSVPDED